MKTLKRELKSCAPYEAMDFLTRWQYLHPQKKLEGKEGLKRIIRQLEGFQVCQAYWEEEIFLNRIRNYHPGLLDELIAGGEVLWISMNPKNLQRGKITFCLKDDIAWLLQGSNRYKDKSVAGGYKKEFVTGGEKKESVAAGVSFTGWKYDGSSTADEDISEEIIIVRNYFIRNKTCTFDQLVRKTGLNENTLLRAVWHLAWCGEITCSTYECLRHAGFHTTLSACYDLASTPKKIINGRITADSVIHRMKNRRMDPSLGTWQATGLLNLPGKEIPGETIVKNWVQLLLERWGIISKEIVKWEINSPSWGMLIKELIRLELLGKIRRGYFIENFEGEQYGLPEAIDLLRDCRARRSGGKELGYMKGEGVFAVTNHDPANLYSAGMDILDDAGNAIQFGSRSGNLYQVYALQAGQVMVLGRNNPMHILQLAHLTREQLETCLEQICKDTRGNRVEVKVKSWNNHPIEVSPIAAVLWNLGFRFNSRRELCYPAPKKELFLEIDKNIGKEFPAHYEEVAPVEYDEEWLISRSSRAIQLKVREFIAFLKQHLPPDCVIGYRSDFNLIHYKGKRLAYLIIQQKQISISIAHTGWAPPVRISPKTNLTDPDFIHAFQSKVENTVKAIEEELVKKRL